MAKRNGAGVYKVRQSCRICFNTGLSIRDGIYVNFTLRILCAAERDASGFLRKLSQELDRQFGARSLN